MKHYLSILFLLISFIVKAEIYNFSRLDNTHGLSNNQIECIFKDSRGFMWFGTNFGLNRYDGYQVKVFLSSKNNPNSLLYNPVPKIQEDFKGNLWLTGNPSAVVYDVHSEQFIRDLRPYLEELGVHFIPTLVEIDAEKNFYFYQPNSGVWKYEIKSKKLIQFKQSVSPNDLTPGPISAIKGDHGYCWVIHTSGLLERFDEARNTVDFRNQFIQDNNRGAVFTKKIFLDSKGNPWVFPGLGDKGVLKYDFQKLCWVYYGNNRLDFHSPYDKLITSDLVRDLAEDKLGNIWIATDHGGINILNKQSEVVSVLRNDPMNPNSISQNSCISLFSDDCGIVWVGTYKNGVSFYHPGMFKFNKTPLFFFHHPDLETKDCNVLYQDNRGDLWIGTNGNGLLQWNKKAGTFNIYRHQKDNPSSISSDIVISMTQDLSGDMWFGTYMGGLNQLKSGRFIHYQPDANNPNTLSNKSIYGLRVDQGNNLWIGTLGGGVDKLDPTRKVFQRHDIGNMPGLSNNTILSMWTGDHSLMYLSTTIGVDVLNTRNNTVQSAFGDTVLRNKLTDLVVYNSIQDRRKLLWIATDNGLNIFDPAAKTMQYLTKSNGLPSDQVVSLIEDNSGNIWVGTRNGLACVYPKKEGGKLVFSVVSFDENDGLPSSIINQNSLYKNPAGILFVGTTKGYSLFDPKTIRFNTIVPKPRFTGLSIGNSDVSAGEKYRNRKVLSASITDLKKLTLHYDERNFTIYFSALSYIHPEKNNYKYKLKGFDDEWINTRGGICSASYTNLNTGSYELLVYASNNDNVWSQVPLRLKIVVKPPFWWTWWAILLYILLILYVLWFYFDFKMRQQKSAFDNEQRIRDARQLHEIDEMKFRFFTNISHEFRTPLTLIISPVEKMLQEERKDGEKTLLETVQRNAYNLLELVNQLLDFRKLDVQKDTLNISVGDVVAFVRDICYSFTELANKKAIHFSFSTALTELSMEFDQEKLRKIVYNLLSNAFKFTRNNGKIDVLLSLSQSPSEDKKFLEITVKDTGIGIPESDLQKVFERFYRVEHPDNANQTGTGVGLHIVSEYVKLHQGDISVKSMLGKGSAFTVLLPVNQHVHEEIITQNIAMPENAVELDELKLPVDEKGKMPLMLVVDDNEDFRHFITALFNDTFRMLEAPDGEVAFKMILDRVPDIIICDVMMPKMDGLELCRLVKHDMRISHIPIILLTAKAGDENKYRGLEAGAEDYIAKPFNMEMLTLKVNNIVERQRKTREQFRKKVEVTPGEVEITSLDEKFVRKAVALVEANISNPEFLVEDLCREMGMSRVYFYKKILALTDKTPSEFIRFIRLKRAADLLEKSQLFVNEVAFQVGFNDPKYFRKYFKDEFGQSPNEYKKKFTE
jgi:signal transduction histidine kinase/ligand-binding sensor domain-containing protein/DNA-binding response OmpR family regulator